MKLLYLCLKHYDLASTTVTGIPMKVLNICMVTTSSFITLCLLFGEFCTRGPKLRCEGGLR